MVVSSTCGEEKPWGGSSMVDRGLGRRTWGVMVDNKENLGKGAPERPLIGAAPLNPGCVWRPGHRGQWRSLGDPWRHLTWRWDGLYTIYKNVCVFYHFENSTVLTILGPSSLLLISEKCLWLLNSLWILRETPFWDPPISFPIFTVCLDHFPPTCGDKCPHLNFWGTPFLSHLQVYPCPCTWVSLFPLAFNALNLECRSNSSPGNHWLSHPTYWRTVC